MASKKINKFQKIAALVSALILLINFGLDSLIGLIGLVTGIGGEIIRPLIIYTPLTLGIFIVVMTVPKIIESPDFPKDLKPYILSLFPLLMFWISSSTSRFHLTLLHHINPDFLIYDPTIGLAGNLAWQDLSQAQGPSHLRFANMFIMVMLGFADTYGAQGFCTSIIAGLFAAWSWKHFELPDKMILVLFTIVFLFFISTFPLAFFVKLFE